MEQSTAAYDQREELCTKLQQLKDKSQNDKLAHVQVGDMTALSLISRRLINKLLQEMRELQRKLDHDAKLQQFLGVKGQHRVNTELEAREMNKKRQQLEEMENQLEQYNTIIEKIKVNEINPLWDSHF